MSLETVSEEPVVVAAAADAVDDAPSTAVDEHSENVSTDTSTGDSSTVKEDSPSSDVAIEEEKKNENVEEEKEEKSQVEENRCSPHSSSPVLEHDEEENSAVVSVKDDVEEDVKDVKDQLDNEEEQADEQDEEHIEEHDDDGDDVVIEDVLDDESEIDSRSDIQSVSSIINAQHSDLDESFDEHDHEDRIAVYDSESDSHSHAPYDEDEELLEGEEKDGEEEEQKQSDAEDEDSEKNAIDDGGDTQQTNSEEHSDLSDSPSSSASDSSKDAKKAAAFSRPNNKFSGARGGRRGGGFQANRGDRYPDRRSFGPNTTRPSNPVPPRRGGLQTPPLQRGGPRGEAEDGSTLFITNWGFRSNLIDQNGNFQRATTDLKNYIAAYKAKYFYFFDLVNGRYPQYVRTLFDKMEIWRMSFNVYASGFSDYIAHLGEIHAFYQMEYVDNELRWVYKDFNFYPNKMRYGFKVNTYDIADVHSRFVKFLCIRDNIIKQFPYVNIHHKDFIGKKFGDNLCNMMSRLEALKRQSPSISIASNHSLEREDEHVTTAAVSPPRDEQIAQPSAYRVSPPNDGGDGGGRFLAQTFERPRFKTTYHRSSGQGTPMPRRGLMSGRPVRRGNYRG